MACTDSLRSKGEKEKRSTSFSFRIRVTFKVTRGALGLTRAHLRIEKCTLGIYRNNEEWKCLIRSRHILMKMALRAQKGSVKFATSFQSTSVHVALFYNLCEVR